MIGQSDAGLACDRKSVARCWVVKEGEWIMEEPQILGLKSLPQQRVNDDVDVVAAEMGRFLASCTIL